jgi:flagellar motility protein MotE (MotC chaperone)
MSGEREQPAREAVDETARPRAAGAALGAPPDAPSRRATPPPSRPAKRRPARAALGGVGLIVLCFVGSAAMRLGDLGAALAEEAGSLSATAAGGPSDAQADSDALLAAIREREAQLTREAERLAERAQTLNVAEARLAEQLAALEQARAELEETLALADNAAERDIAQMTAVYERMKPEDAARIFARMELSFAAGLLARMKPDTAALVLAGMEPDTAYAVTLMVASRHARVPTD